MRQAVVRLLGFALMAWFAGITGSAGAATVGFVDQPTSNLADWTNYVANLDPTPDVNESVDFDTHPVGPLDGNFYAVKGATLSASGHFGGIVFGVGPGGLPGNNVGEGPHAASNYLTELPKPVPTTYISTLTISFDGPWQAIGAGLSIIGYANGFANAMTIEAFDEGGAPLPGGSFDAVGAANFQPNNIYFMGVATDDLVPIGSIRFTHTEGSFLGNPLDVIGIDNIVFATIPEPSTLAGLVGMGMLGLVACVRRRRNNAA